VKLHKAVIYCRTENYNNIKIQRSKLDTLFFRLQAFAHAHNLSVVNYYEDIRHSPNDHTRPGLLQLLSDSKCGDFDTILVASYDQLGDDSIQQYPFFIPSLDISERGAGISSLMNYYSL